MQIRAIMSPDPVTVDQASLLAEALATLEELDIRHLPVVNDGRVVGVVSDRDLLESTGWMWNEERGKAPVIVADVVQSDAMTVGPEETVGAVATRLVEWGVGCAPVVEEGRLVGIATEIDVLRAYAVARDTGELPDEGVTVEKRMSADVTSLELDATATDALTSLREHGIRHLPVVDGVGVVGLVSDRDLRGVLGRALAGSTPVREFMSADVQTIGPDDDIARAARLMAQLKIGGLPVVDHGGLVGMITITDLLQHCAETMG